MSAPPADEPGQDPARDALAARVVALLEAPAGEEPPDAWDAARAALAVDLLRRQARAVGPYARLVAARGVDPDRVGHPAELPALPADAFRFARVAAHAPAHDVRRFRTSGTTGERGEHALAELRFYDLAARHAAAAALFPDAPGVRPRLVVLAPHDSEAPDSSLAYMLARFEGWFGDGRGAWCLPGGALDAERLVEALSGARADGVPAALLGTSFAFVHAGDALGDRRVPLPPGSRAMITGGFKGRAREVAPDALRREVAARFGLEEADVVGEYGMTELSSQAWETTLADAWRGRSARPRRYRPPPWMRITAVDPESLEPVPRGAVGVLRIDDLANVDSVVAVQTADLGRVHEDGVEVLGRASGAVPRGCALALDEALGGGRA